MRSVLTRTIYGHVLSTGIQDRGNFSVGVQKTATGVYVVTLFPGLRALGWNCTTDSGGGALVDTDIMNDRGFTARTYLSSTGAATDWGFHFIVQAVS